MSADHPSPAARGPHVLARNAIVSPGQPTPGEWSDCERIVVDLDRHDAAELADRLHALSDQRIGCVIELHPDTDAQLSRPFSTARPPSEVGPRVRFARQQLRHLVDANSVDHRIDGRLTLLDEAVRLGARPTTDGVGDVELPDGSRTWLDGGPPGYTAPIDGVAVLHRVAIEHGSLRPPLDNECTADLAPDQLAAVVHERGAARVIAPAGSGKTTVLTARARHLVQRWRIPPSAITLIAFNKRAQEEMAARTADLPGLQIRTLNALALAIVNGAPPFARQSQRVATIDEPAVRRLIGRLVSFPRVRNADPVATWIEALSLARLGLVDPADVEARYDGEVARFAEVFAEYRATLQRDQTVDYDEQVFRAVELLLRDPEARRVAQRTCRLLLVDEFQDLTPAHLLLVRLLAGPDDAVFGVGDDDQTIYGYNGADPAWLIDFAELFPGATMHPLEVNYRCPAGIVRAADQLLQHNRVRVAKTIRAAHEPGPAPDGFDVRPESPDPVAVTVDAVAAQVAAGRPLHDIAVLTRVNSLLVPVQVALRVAGIATRGGVGTEYTERTAVRSAIAWLRLACADAQFDPADVVEALRRPSRSIHPNVAKWVGEQRSVRDLRRLAGRINTERDAERVGQFADDIERLQLDVRAGRSTSHLFAALRDGIGLASSIEKLDAHRHGMNRAAQNDDLTALAQLALQQPRPGMFEPWLRASLLAPPPDGAAVTLATVHRVKGLEWPFVVVHHADHEQFPHRLADDLEEERRLFHVAITRASQRVVVVPSEQPSPFIAQCTNPPRAVVRSTGRPSAKVTPAATTEPVPHGAANDRFEALRVWRRSVADGKPAYTVFSDAVLRDIALHRPVSLGELSRHKGVGAAKLERYGADVLRVLDEVDGRPS